MLVFNKHKYYTSLEDFLTNVPKRLDILYQTKLNNIVAGRVVAPANLLYGIFWPFSFSGKAQIYLKTGESNFNNIFNDFEIGVTHFSSSNNIHSALSNIFYRNKINNTNIDIDFTNNSQIELRTGFFDNLFEFCKYLVTYLQGSYPTTNIVKNQLIKLIINKLEYIIDNKDKFIGIRELENRKYECDIDLSLAIRQGQVYNKINNFSIFSGKTGLRLTNHNEINPLKGWSMRGIAGLNNYPKIIDLLSGYLYQFAKFKELTAENQKLYTEAIKYFLKSISDYPKSISDDLTFEYKIDSTNLDKGAIGTIEVHQLKMLYYLALWQKLIATGKSPEEYLKTIKELAPDLSENELEFLQQLIIKSPSNIK
jgi:hypothetical protein